MHQLRKNQERGHANHGWLDSYHTFSFADYYDRDHMGFSVLRVINEDYVAEGKGFPTHAHRDMEIITYMLEGALEHKDSMGNGSVIRPGDVQRMSAGSGVTHSEFNASKIEPAHLLQIWILPRVTDIPPSYEQKFFTPEEKQGKLKLIASPNGRDGSVSMNQDAFLYAALLDGSDSLQQQLNPKRKYYVHVARGSLRVNSTALAVGDALKIESETEMELSRADNAEILLFDLP